MAFDYKKEYKEFYLPPATPQIVDVPPMNYIAVQGHGNPNDEDGEYKAAMNLLYGVALTIKMSPRAGYAMEGYFEYVVPPLEGFWWQEGVEGIDYRHKEDYCWISILRLPDFVTREEFDWAVAEATRKKHADFSAVRFFPYTEGLSVQCLHIGPYDTEPATVAKMEDFLREQGYTTDITATRYHHEIYLSDARRCAPEKLRTVIRHPIRRLP